MKNPNRQTVVSLEELPNIGKAIAADLRLIGIKHPQDLLGKNPFKLHQDLCKTTNKKHDLCELDVFMAAIHFMEGGSPQPWWDFTKTRKKILKPPLKGQLICDNPQ